MSKFNRLYSVRKAIINTELTNWNIIESITKKDTLVISPTKFYNLVGFVGILTVLNLTKDEQTFVSCMKELSSKDNKGENNE